VTAPDFRAGKLRGSAITRSATEANVITITIEWSDTHHPGDGYDMISSHLAAGYDEGPMLVVIAHPPVRPGGRPEAVIFADVQSYLAHVATYEGELEGERWVGLVRNVKGGDTSHALAALDHLKKLVGPARPGGGSRVGPARPGGGPRRGRGGSAAAHDYLVLRGPFVSDADLAIRNMGDGFIEIAHAFPTLEESMTCLSDEEW
jgi:hypothetical protein